ncbi:diaminopimelate decarboxylase family protein [Sciscionella sediminilitoris]|uniref:diaminopimelate decarboxylase family protein n=1 Tax=Sciscionella sediminilitoris TaxID=1445613 RepID=UPI0009EC7B74|nr:hypothetical protein [Sciscionella sp. SE31]
MTSSVLPVASVAPDHSPYPQLAEAVGTPAYVLDPAAIDAAADSATQAFGEHWIRSYSLKANPLPEVVSRLHARGWGANVVSLGEWEAARRAGVPNAETTMEGIGKTDAELRAAIAAARDGDPLRWVSLETLDEARRFAQLCGPVPLDVLLRINPAVRPETHAGLAVGSAESKFGLRGAELRTLLDTDPFAGTGIRVRGVHVHVGSQLGEVTAWRNGAHAALEALDLVRTKHSGADTVDFGGGFPVLGTPSGPGPSAADFAAVLTEHELPARCAIEPGRALVAEAGALLASVLHVRDLGGTQQVVLDTGMTELIRPALYGARHPVHALTAPDAPVLPTELHGPVCESADRIGHYELPALHRGDLVLIGMAGAYSSALETTYNGRPHAPKVSLDPETGPRVVQDRERLAALRF